MEGKESKEAGFSRSSARRRASCLLRSRPGRCGHPKGCVLEGRELQFYQENHFPPILAQVIKVFILKKKKIFSLLGMMHKLQLKPGHCRFYETGS